MAKNVGINIKIGADLKEFSKQMQNVQREMKRTGKRLKSIGTSMTTALTLPLGLMGGAMIKFASDVEESLNKVDVAFGDSSKEVKEFSETTLKSFGIARGSALEMASTFGDMATSMGIGQSSAAAMSTKLVGLAGDLASFKNIRIDVAQTALNSIFTGETESLKKLGIVMTQANLSAFALEKGIKKPIKAMSEGEKTMLRYQFVMEKTSNAHGDFERTGGGAANQMRIFQEGLKELAEKFGSIVLPIFTKAIKKLNSLVEWFSGLSDTTKKYIIVAASLVAAIGPVLMVVGQMSTGIAALIPLITKLGVATGLAAGGLGLAVAAIGAIVFGIVKLNKHLNENHPLTKKTRELTDGLRESTDNLKKQVDELNGVNTSGLAIDNATRESLKLKTEQTIKDTQAKLQNAIATRKQMKAEMEARLDRALAATQRGGGMHSDVGFSSEMAGAERIKKSISNLDTEIASAMKGLADMGVQLNELGKTKDIKIPILDQLKESTGGGKRSGFNTLSVDAKQAAIDLGDFGKVAAEIPQKIEGIAYPMDELIGKASEFSMAMVNATNQLVEGIKQIAVDTFSDLFESIGESIAGGEDAFKNFGKNTLANVADFMGKFGKLLMAGAIASEAMQKTLFTNPLVALAAGAALVVASGAIKQMSGQNPVDGAAGTTSSGYSPISYSNGFGTDGGTLTLETVVYGNDIVLSSNRQNGTISRTRRK